MGKIKVCWLITPLAIWGGVIRDLNLWAKYLDKENFDITMIYYSKDRQRVENMFSKNDIKLVYSEGLGSRRLVFVPGILHLTRYLKSNQFDIIHSIFPHSDFIINICSKILKSGVPIISYSAGEIVPYAYPCIKKAISSVLYSMLYRTVRNNFDVFLTLSENTKKYLVDTFHIPEDKINVIKIGIDFKQYEIKQKQSSKRPFINIGCAARFTREKGLEVLLNALGLVIKKRGNVIKLFLAGKGPEFDRIKTFIRVKRLESNVEFLGWVEDMSEFFKRIDVFTFPSFQEGTPRAILESFYHFVPVIASNVGGIPNILLNNKTGVLIDPGDFETLAEKICLFLDNKYLIHQYGHNAHDYVIENHDILKQVSALEEIYENLYMKGSF